jgi:hypothetical protein
MVSGGWQVLEVNEAISENNSRVEVIIGGWHDRRINTISGRSMSVAGTISRFAFVLATPNLHLVVTGHPGVRLPIMQRLVRAALRAATKTRPRSLHLQSRCRTDH